MHRTKSLAKKTQQQQHGDDNNDAAADEDPTLAKSGFISRGETMANIILPPKRDAGQAIKEMAHNAAVEHRCKLNMIASRTLRRLGMNDEARDVFDRDSTRS